MTEFHVARIIFLQKCCPLMRRLVSVTLTGNASAAFKGFCDLAPWRGIE
jgi:hypothetical protein